MLTELVERGDLPALKERLPRSPLVVKPLDESGVYGGELRLVVVGGPESVGGYLDRTIGYDHLVRWAPKMDTWTADDVLPDIAESYSTNDDATEYVFKLRPGMKWSDGKAFGADDIVFWYEDVVLNIDITPVIPTWLQAGDKPFKVEKVDDHTIAFRFSGPHGLLLGNLATASGVGPTRHPAHYLRKFHQKYTPDVATQAKEAGLDRWADLFLQKASPWENAELPVLSAWQVTKGTGEISNRMTARRNPYYWKVDSEGRQLPYIDEVSYQLVSDNEVAKLKTLGGEVDLVFLTIMMDLRDKPLIAQGREKGKFQILDLVYEDSNTMAFALNLVHRQPAMRKILSDINFRIGLSHAMNRQEIIDTIFLRQGEPYQVAPHPGTPYYNEKLAKQFTEYSVETANRYLDRVLPNKDGDGRRLGPNGKPFSFTVDVGSDARPRDVATLEIMRQQFAAVGVNMHVKAQADALFWERVSSNVHDAAVFGCGGGLDPVFQQDFMIPLQIAAIPWTNWYNAGGLTGAIPKGAAGPIEEPAPAAREQMELYYQLRNTADTAKQTELMNRVIDIAQQQFWYIGVSLPKGNYGVVSNRLRNVQNPMIDDYPWQTPGPTNMTQYFIRQK
ncbi:ABC transporter substrate-binding protein [Actinopolymorpha alba]|uniref:ABC transporter substrate-binding protein n=1 Tax=Actinopolymorpha alba TaxID=533267 RepID=UPI000371C5B5|nr:ABC transporter substrate-binding protein [Actinopolymorpha alba]